MGRIIFFLVIAGLWFFRKQIFSKILSFGLKKAQSAASAHQEHRQTKAQNSEKSVDRTAGNFKGGEYIDYEEVE